MMRIWVRLKGGLTYIFGDYGLMYESNYFNIPISEDRSEDIEVAGRPTVQGANRREEGRKWQSVYWEAAESPVLEVSGASFVEAKANFEISGFGEGVGGRHKVGEFRQKGEVSIDAGDGIDRKGACVCRYWDFA